MSPYAIRPIREADAVTITNAFDHDLSPESRYLRFHSAWRHLPESLVHYLTHVDGVDHVALVAIDDGGAGLGVARFVRDHDDATKAELAVVVVDHAQGHGIGRRLVQALAVAARERGIRTFTMFVLVENERVRHVLESFGAVGRRDDPDAITYELSVAALTDDPFKTA